MNSDIVNTKNETVGSLDLNDDVFGGRVKTDLIWEVGRAARTRRSGAARTRRRTARSSAAAARSRSKQKGTGRPQVGRNPHPAVAEGRHGVRPAAAQLRLTSCRRRSKRGALRAALAQKLQRRRAHRRRRARGRATSEDQGRPRRCSSGSARRARRCDRREAGRELHAVGAQHRRRAARARAAA